MLIQCILQPDAKKLTLRYLNTQRNNATFTDADKRAQNGVVQRTVSKTSIGARKNRKLIFAIEFHHSTYREILEKVKIQYKDCSRLLFWFGG